jgi:hypothetical protein
VKERQPIKPRGAPAKAVAPVDRASQPGRRGDESEVPAVSEDCFKSNTRNLRDYLLTSGYAEDHDEFDDALRQIRKTGIALFTPRAMKFED